MRGATRPVRICRGVKPSSAAALSTNFGTGWWKTAWA